MSTRKSTIALLSASLFATAGFAATVAEPETPGSPEAQAVAETIHNARDHGTTNLARQPIAQAPGSEKSQAVSESIHLQREHGNINDSADQRMLRDAARL